MISRSLLRTLRRNCISPNILFGILLVIVFVCFFILNPQYFRDNESTYYNKNPRYANDRSDISIKSSLEGVYPEINIINKSGPSIKRGGTVIFYVRYTGNIASVMLGNGSIVLKEFVGTLGIQKVDDRTAEITIKNIDTNDISTLKYIMITGGTAMSSTGNLSEFVISNAFTMQLTNFEQGVKRIFDISGWLLVPIIFNLITPLVTPKIKNDEE
jgi:hypothetical protein